MSERLHNGDRFSGLGRYEDQPDGLHAKLLEPLSYTTKDGWTITAEAGEETDFASIPRPLQLVIPPRGKYNRPAAIHDHLYRYAPIDPTTGQRCTQARADAIIREACEDVDDRFTQRWAIYLGLRVGGFKAWNDYRAKEHAAAAALSS